MTSSKLIRSRMSTDGSYWNEVDSAAGSKLKRCAVRFCICRLVNIEEQNVDLPDPAGPGLQYFTIDIIIKLNFSRRENEKWQYMSKAQDFSFGEPKVLRTFFSPHTNTAYRIRIVVLLSSREKGLTKFTWLVQTNILTQQQRQRERERERERPRIIIFAKSFIPFWIVSFSHPVVKKCLLCRPSCLTGLLPVSLSIQRHLNVLYLKLNDQMGGTQCDFMIFVGFLN